MAEEPPSLLLQPSAGLCQLLLQCPCVSGLKLLHHPCTRWHLLWPRLRHADKADVKTTISNLEPSDGGRFRSIELDLSERAAQTCALCEHPSIWPFGPVHQDAAQRRHKAAQLSHTLLPGA